MMDKCDINYTIAIPPCMYCGKDLTYIHICNGGNSAEGICTHCHRHFAIQHEADPMKRNPIGQHRWASDVKGNAGWKCQKCGAQFPEDSAELHAHHIWEYRKYPEAAFSRWNGVSLCKECHQRLHAGDKECARWILPLKRSTVRQLNNLRKDRGLPGIYWDYANEGRV